MKNVEFLIAAWSIAGILYGGYLVRLLIRIKSLKSKLHK